MCQFHMHSFINMTAVVGEHYQLHTSVMGESENENDTTKLKVG